MSSIDVRGAAVQAVAAKVLSDRVKEYRLAVNANLAAALDVGDRKTAALDSGIPVGSITYTKGRTSAVVTDPAAFTAWVVQNYPDEVVPQVRPAFRDAVLAATRTAGVPMAPDGTLEVPGVSLAAGEPYLTVKHNPDTVDALVDAIRAGQLLALEDPR